MTAKCLTQAHACCTDCCTHIALEVEMMDRFLARSIQGAMVEVERGGPNLAVIQPRTWIHSKCCIWYDE